MLLSRVGGSPTGNPSGVGFAAALLLAVLAGGCSSAPPYDTAQEWAAAQVSDASTVRTSSRVVGEDGVEAQVPPAKRAGTEPDDPSEPFSPNYGPPPIVRNAALGIKVDPIPVDLPPDFRRKLATALGSG